MNSQQQINSMMESSLALDQGKHDHTIQARSIQVDDLARFVLPPSVFGEIPPLSIEDWAFGQFCQKAGPAVLGSTKSLPRAFLDALPPDWKAYNMRRAIELQEHGKKWMVRCDSESARAILGGAYPTITNTELLSKLLSLVEEKGEGVTLVNSRITRDYLSVRTVWRHIDPGNGPYGFGVALLNGEIGNAEVATLPLVWRGSCTNSIIVDDENAFRARHVGDINYLRFRIAQAFMNALKLGAEWLQRFLVAEETEMDDFEETLNQVVKDQGWGDKELAVISVGAEGRQTYGGLINGLTRYSQTIDNPEEQTRVEILAGEWLKRVGVPRDEI